MQDSRDYFVGLLKYFTEITLEGLISQYTEKEVLITIFSIFKMKKDIKMVPKADIVVTV